MYRKKCSSSLANIKLLVFSHCYFIGGSSAMFKCFKANRKRATQTLFRSEELGVTLRVRNLHQQLGTTERKPYISGRGVNSRQVRVNKIKSTTVSSNCLKINFVRKKHSLIPKNFISNLVCQNCFDPKND